MICQRCERAVATELILILGEDELEVCSKCAAEIRAELDGGADFERLDLEGLGLEEGER